MGRLYQKTTSGKTTLAFLAYFDGDMYGAAVAVVVTVLASTR